MLGRYWKSQRDGWPRRCRVLIARYVCLETTSLRKFTQPQHMFTTLWNLTIILIGGWGWVAFRDVVCKTLTTPRTLIHLLAYNMKISQCSFCSTTRVRLEAFNRVLSHPDRGLWIHWPHLPIDRGAYFVGRHTHNTLTLVDF